MIRKIAIIIALVLGSLFLMTAAAAAVLYFSHSGEYEVPATSAEDSNLPYIELEAYRFHAETFGNPEHPAVIVLHGGPGGDYRSILPLADLADDGFFVVFYDQRGSGLSPRVNEEELTIERFVADLDLFVEHYSPNRPVFLVGHSWGAMLASMYISSHPEKVEKVVLAEPGFLDHEHMEIFYTATGLRDMKPSFSVIAALAGAWAASLHIRNPAPQVRQDYLLNAFFTTPMEDHPLAGYYPDDKLENAAGEYWRFGALASSSIPKSGMDEEGRLMDLAAGAEDWEGAALFISGSENAIIGPDYQRSQMSRYPGSELVVIEGAGHTMIGEKPEKSLEAIRTFLKD